MSLASLLLTLGIVAVVVVVLGALLAWLDAAAIADERAEAQYRRVDPPPSNRAH